MGRDYTRREVVQVLSRALDEALHDAPLIDVIEKVDYMTSLYILANGTTTRWGDEPYVGDDDPPVEMPAIEVLRKKLEAEWDDANMNPPLGGDAYEQFVRSIRLKTLREVISTIGELTSVKASIPD